MQVSWINPEEVASLAASLRGSPRRASPAAEEAGLSLFEAEDLAALTEALEDFGIEVRPPPGTEVEAPLPPVSEPSLPEPPHVEAEASTPVPETEEAFDEVPALEETRPLESAPAPEAAPMAGLEGGPDLKALRQRLQEIRERAVDAGLLPAPPVVVSSETASPGQTLSDDPPPSLAEGAAGGAPGALQRTAFEVPLGGVMARLEAFALWARGSISPGELFVVDDRGDLLWGPQDQASLILSMLMAVNAAARASAWSACGEARVIHQVLPTGRLVTIIPCATRLGMIQVAVAAAETLSPEETDLLRGALLIALDSVEPEVA